MKTLWLPLLLSSVIWAEEDYFLISPDATWNEPGLNQSNGTLNDTGLNRYNTTWDEARNHCQACYKELATITSGNVHHIVQNLSLDYWIGLRRSYNGTFPWSRWSNGDPVTYQNWYPGHPLPNKVKKMIPICSSTTQSPLSTLITTTSTPVTNASTETPTETTTQTSTQTTTQTTTQTSTQTTTQTSTVSSPVTFPQFSTLSENNNTDVCPILYNVLECLNMTYEELERTVHEYSSVTPKTTTYSTTTNPTTYSTTTTPTTYSTTTNPTTFSTIFTTTGYETQNTTMNSTTTESTTASNCIFEPEPDTEVYIEDACVVLLSFGMWKEKNCNETLPFICYDDRFLGEIDVSNVNTSAGNVSWSSPPGNITHYKVEITWNQTKQTSNETDQYKQLLNLTPGNLYKVQVFPVKCGRDLYPQTISFYTKPSDIEYLTVVNVTNVTASLSWSKSEGDREYYSVHIKGMDSEKDQECKSEECTITDLIPGNSYTFTVTAIVNKTSESVPISVSNYTMPSVVLNLTSTGKESTVITASWSPPNGNHSGYRYCLYESSDCAKCNCPTNYTITTVESIKEENKTDGTMYCLCVAALTNNNTLSGETVVIPAYTSPETVTLSLSSTKNSITASWTLKGNYQQFNLTIRGLTDNLTHTDTTTNKTYTFKGLKPGVQYEVSVVTLNGNLSSDPANESYYTAPTEPAWVQATSNGTRINVTWGAPEDSKGATINYTVTCGSAFWKTNTDPTYTTDTNTTFTDLKSGTRYTCSVSVVAGNLTSSPVTAQADTEPKKKTLTLTMLCSSETPLHCENPTTQSKLFEKLNNTFKETFHDHVHWKLKWVDRNVINP